MTLTYSSDHYHKHIEYKQTYMENHLIT